MGNVWFVCFDQYKIAGFPAYYYTKQHGFGCKFKIQAVKNTILQVLPHIEADNDAASGKASENELLKNKLFSPLFFSKNLMYNTTCILLSLTPNAKRRKQ